MDGASDAAYLAFGPVEEGEATQQVMIDDDRLMGEVVLDLNSDGRLLGIEFLGFFG
ncbi:DUF2283 domain-containing protein [Antribacter gilvus]|uniref:DUF2283 domain-containing protein n=1 Tax=Antribacter gilvus TaxID=2304675 RepID=UPI0013E0C39D|nr:DUF2283 domain-containing protein [Antribacter gilvus]